MTLSSPIRNLFLTLVGLVAVCVALGAALVRPGGDLAPVRRVPSFERDEPPAGAVPPP